MPPLYSPVAPGQFASTMKKTLSLLVAAALFGSGSLHAEEKAAGTDANEREEAIAGLPLHELTPRILYRFLLAEVAGQRGQLGTTADLYLELARETRDPRIVRRATELALHARRLETAMQSVRIWLEIDPQSSQARQTYIGLLAAQGNHDELGTMAAAILAAEPDRIGPNLLHLNRLLARSPDRKAVRELVDQLTEPYLQRPEAHYSRALAAAEVRDMPAAKTAARHALALKPDWEIAALLLAQVQEDRQEAIALLGDFIAANPQASEARLAYARTLVGEKRYTEARREFGKLLEQGANDPAKNGDTIFAVAVLSLQLNDTREAEKHLRQLVDIGHAETDKARFYLGQIAEESKRWDDALAWFVQVRRGEHYLPSRLHAANVLARLGRLDDARRHLADSEAGKPAERIQLLIGEAQLLREAGRIADAHATLVGGLAQYPDQPELLYEAALMAEKLGRSEELEIRLRRLIELKPDHAHALNALGYSLADRNIRLGEARSLIERALLLAPNDPFILDSKGWVLFRQGNLQAALDVLGAAIGLRSDPEIAAHLGEVLWHIGRQADARATWEKARQAYPDNAVLTETIKRFLP